MRTKTRCALIQGHAQQKSGFDQWHDSAPLFHVNLGKVAFYAFATIFIRSEQRFCWLQVIFSVRNQREPFKAISPLSDLIHHAPLRNHMEFLPNLPKIERPIATVI